VNLNQICDGWVPRKRDNVYQRLSAVYRLILQQTSVKISLVTGTSNCDKKEEAWKSPNSIKDSVKTTRNDENNLRI
ncbi:unnamed protein product, partial [Cylicostephanus goldi]